MDSLPSPLQCTPDLLPADITGLSVFNQRTDFEFRPGLVFANVLLGRDQPRHTQDAVRPARGMAERQVTIDGVTRHLPRPFLVLATQNPVELEGTFPLPEAQLDRFLLRLALGYPSVEEELRIVEEQVVKHPLSGLAPWALARRGERAAGGGAGRVRRSAAPPLGDPARARDAGGRGNRHRRLLPVRGSLAPPRALGRRVGAASSGREFVTTVDIEKLFLPVVMHRIVFTPSFVATAREIGWQEAADSVPAPVPRDRASTGGGAGAGGVCMRVAADRSGRLRD